MNLYKGTQWFSITDNLAKYILSQENFIKSNFRYSLCPDELFLHTVTANSQFRDHIANNALRFIDWERGEPYTFTEDDYCKLINSEHLFARKFDETKDSQIIDMILSYISST